MFARFGAQGCFLTCASAMKTKAYITLHLLLTLPYARKKRQITPLLGCIGCGNGLPVSRSNKPIIRGTPQMPLGQKRILRGNDPITWGWAPMLGGDEPVFFQTAAPESHQKASYQRICLRARLRRLPRATGRCFAKFPCFQFSKNFRISKIIGFFIQNNPLLRACSAD